jgi:hypothetical protein
MKYYKYKVNISLKLRQVNASVLPGQVRKIIYKKEPVVKWNDEFQEWDITVCAPNIAEAIYDAVSRVNIYLK